MGRKALRQPEPMRLFMAFPDGVYHYVCQECDAHCCRGQGFAGNLKREMTQLLTLYPALGSAAVAREGNILTFATPTGRCHFLDGDNLCRIEKNHGKALKPGVCSLFPFNSFTRIGNVIAVSPHFMCPLRMQVPVRPGEVAGTHAVIAEAVLETGLLDQESTNKRQRPAFDVEAVLQRETDFRDACAAALGQRQFSDVLYAHSEDASALKTIVKRATALLGVMPRESSRDGIDDLLLAMASPLRLGFLPLPSEEILRLLALSEVMLRWVAALSPQAPTLQGAHKIITSAQQSLRLLARGDEPLELLPRANLKSPQFHDAEMTFAAFLALREVQKGTGVLTALEKALPPLLSMADRSILLLQIEHKLEVEIAAHQQRRVKGKRPKPRTD